MDAGAVAEVLEEIGSFDGFTPGSFMPGGGGAGAKCGAVEDEDVCANAGDTARTERASKQAACFMTYTSLGV